MAGLVSTCCEIPILFCASFTDSQPVLQYSGGSPLGALCGRGDLDPKSPRAYGCYDTKAATWAMALRLEADAGAQDRTMAV